MRPVISFILLCLFSVNANAAVDGFTINMEGKELNKIIADEIYALTNGTPINFPPLGERVLAIASNGLVFINGEYSPPPYVIVRKANKIYINNLLAHTGRALPVGPQPSWKGSCLMAALTPTSVAFETEYPAIDYYMTIMEGGFLMLEDPRRTQDGQCFPQALLPLADALVAATNEAQFAAIMQTNMPPGGISGKGLANFWKHREQVNAWGPMVKEIDRKREDEIKQREVARLRYSPMPDEQYDEFEDAMLAHDYSMLEEREDSMVWVMFFRRMLPLSDALAVATNEVDFLTVMRTNMLTADIPERRLQVFWKYRSQSAEWGPKVRKLVREWDEAIAKEKRIRILTEGFQLSDIQFVDISRVLAEAKNENEFMALITNNYPYMINESAYSKWLLKQQDCRVRRFRSGGSYYDTVGRPPYLGEELLKIYYRHPDKMMAGGPVWRIKSQSEMDLMFTEDLRSSVSESNFVATAKARFSTRDLHKGNAITEGYLKDIYANREHPEKWRATPSQEPDEW